MTHWLSGATVSAVAQIAILYCVIYAILKRAKGSRFGQALTGVGVLAAVLFAFAYLFKFDVLTRIVQFLQNVFEIRKRHSGCDQRLVRVTQYGLSNVHFHTMSLSLCVKFFENDFREKEV